MAGGVRRVLSIGAIINDKDRYIFNRYVPGAGVGSNNIAVRRAKKIRATPCNSNSLGPSTPQTPQQLTIAAEEAAAAEQLTIAAEEAAAAEQLTLQQ